MVAQSCPSWPDSKAQLCAGGAKPGSCQGGTSRGASWAKGLWQSNSAKIKWESPNLVLLTETRVSDSESDVSAKPQVRMNSFTEVSVGVDEELPMSWS